MNAVEIEEEVATLAAAPFDPANFPYAFLAAFGSKETTLKRLRAGVSNASDVPGAILQQRNIHLAVAPPGQVGPTLAALRASPKTRSSRAKFILATDGDTLEAEDLATSEPLACAYTDMAERFGFFLPLAGISTVKEIANNPIDVKATGRLNKLYVELLRENPDWATEARRPALNQFMARLIFCFFAEDTDIFHGSYVFTATVDRMTRGHVNITHEVIGTLFRAMGTPTAERRGVPTWADGFPFVNGALFTGDGDCPRFTKIALAYLLRAGELDWKEINPDIFGSMIQAVADDEERGALGLHYTSVPNILKVLNPLFLDDLREQLAAAEQNPRKLRNLRRRIAAIRVFDPACGSGNFLVVAYLHMREIEHEIVLRTGDEPKSEIKLTNFYGIEIKGFAAEIARLALLIAEFQSDCRYLSQQEARMMVLPLHKTGQIHVGNALRLDWLSVCPPATASVMEEHDLAGPTGRLALDNAGFNEPAFVHTYICGNPPFSGSRKQTAEQKEDLNGVFGNLTSSWKNVDYVGSWFMKATLYNTASPTPFCFVATNSFCQGLQVAITWRLMLHAGMIIKFAHTSFDWSNLARNKAGVTVVVVGLQPKYSGPRFLFANGGKRIVSTINPYLTDHLIDLVEQSRIPLSLSVSMDYGVYYSKSEGLILSFQNHKSLVRSGLPERLTRRFLGSTQFINGEERYCLWLETADVEEACRYGDVKSRIESVRQDRLQTIDAAVNKLALRPYQFRERKGDDPAKIFVPIVSSVNREYFPAGIADATIIPSNKAFFIPEGPLWCLAILVSRIHLSWIATICGRLRNDYSYSNVLGWNTFPVPPLTERHKADLTCCAEDILLAREVHFPATIADLYDPENMPEDLRRAHEANDETLERIYIGRRFRNDTERLETLFDLYTKMTATPVPKAKRRGSLHARRTIGETRPLS